MPRAIELVEQLKRELKARGLKYADIARRIGVSEATVKRMFSERNFTLERLDAILVAAGIEITDLTRGFDREQHLVSQLTEAQERELVDEPKLFTVAVCTLNLLTFDDILAEYALTAPELVGLLARLDRMGVIELLPNNRFKLRIARTFAWIPSGPIMAAFKNNAHDFFDSDFRRDNECMMLLTARLSRASSAALVDRLKRVAREFSDQHIDDSRLPADQRPPLALLLACRPWQPPFLRGLAREPSKAGIASRLIRRR
ncbi:MAG: helix-turn-helix domain-containing protein [Gemmatimonadota bacterium]